MKVDVECFVEKSVYKKKDSFPYYFIKNPSLFKQLFS